MGSAKRPDLADLSTIGLLFAICLLGATFLVPVQQRASQAGKTYTLTTFTTYVFGVLSGLTREMRLAAALPGQDGETVKNTHQRKDSIARTEWVRQALEKAWTRFDRSSYGASLQRDFDNAVSNLETVERIGDAGPDGVEDAAAIVRSYNAAIARFIRVIGHIDQLALSGGQLQGLETLAMRNVRLAQLVSTEIDLGAAQYSTVKPDADLAARWSSVVSERSKLLKPLPDSSQNYREIVADLAPADALFRSATSRNRDRLPEFGIWADSTISAVSAALSQANAHAATMRTVAGRATVAGDRAFVAVAILALALAYLVLTQRKATTSQQRFVILAVLANGAIIAWHLGSNSVFFSKEDGPLELGQALTLMLAFGLFTLEASRAAKPVRVAALIMACACLLMFYRELDIRILGLPDEFVRMLDFPGRRLIYYVGAGAAGIYALVNRRQLWSLVPRKLELRHWPLYLWPVLLVLGELVEFVGHESRTDDVHGYWATARFWEELLELNAYAVLAFAAFAFARILMPHDALRRK